MAFLVEVSAWPRLTQSTSEYDECKVESSLTSVNISQYEVRTATLCMCVCVRACMRVSVCACIDYRLCIKLVYTIYGVCVYQCACMHVCVYVNTK